MSVLLPYFFFFFVCFLFRVHIDWFGRFSCIPCRPMYDIMIYYYAFPNICELFLWTFSRRFCFPIDKKCTAKRPRATVCSCVMTFFLAQRLVNVRLVCLRARLCVSVKRQMSPNVKNKLTKKSSFSRSWVSNDKTNTSQQEKKRNTHTHSMHDTTNYA